MPPEKESRTNKIIALKHKYEPYNLPLDSLIQDWIRAKRKGTLRRYAAKEKTEKPSFSFTQEISNPRLVAAKVDGIINFEELPPSLENRLVSQPMIIMQHCSQSSPRDRGEDVSRLHGDVVVELFMEKELVNPLLRNVLEKTGIKMSGKKDETSNYDINILA